MSRFKNNDLNLSQSSEWWEGKQMIGGLPREAQWHRAVATSSGSFLAVGFPLPSLTAAST
jgi:hypothetical protein